MDGDPLPIANGGSVIHFASMLSAFLPQVPVGGFPAAENNAISRFLAAVTTRVPELGPSLAVFLPEGGDAMLIAREFRNVVDAAATVLRSVQERCARSTEDGDAFDLHGRITCCIALIEAESADLGLGALGGGVGGGLGLALAPPLHMAAAGFLHPGAGALRHQHQQASVISYQSSVLQEIDVSCTSLKKNNNVSHRDVAKSGIQVDDNMPMMAMYKSTKMATKRTIGAKKTKMRPDKRTRC